MAAIPNLDEGHWLAVKTMDYNFDSPSVREMDNLPPQHPVPTMQGAFEESMVETMAEMAEPAPDKRYSTADSISRRKMLLEQDKYERSVAGKWKQKLGEKFHPLWKLVAQISFGMHLLHQGLAKSDEEVIKILQTHVDEVDGFLERTTEDFNLAQEDIDDRITNLRLPLQHGEVFDTMLMDRDFRMAIVEGNEKIEHIVDRTEIAMKDALKDVQKGLDASRELARYLTRLDRLWENRSEENESVYLAMIGNTEGWTRAFMTLQQKGNKLAAALVTLRSIIAEIQKRAGIASRKNLATISPTLASKYYLEPTSKKNVNFRDSTSPPISPRETAPTMSRSTTDPIQFTKSGTKEDMRRALKLDGRQASNPVSKERLRKRSSEQHVKLQEPPKKSPGGNARIQDELRSPPRPGGGPSVSVSLGERTRALTRKLSFLKRGERATSPEILPIQKVPSNQRSPKTTGVSSPASDRCLAQDVSPKTKPASPKGGNTQVKSPAMVIDPHNLDRTRTVIPAGVSSPATYPTSENSRRSTSPSAKSSIGATVVLAIDGLAEEETTYSHPLIEQIHSKDNLAANTAPLNPANKPILIDLPLRHYRSQENVRQSSSQSINRAKSPSGLARSTSLREDVSPKATSPMTGSSIYSPEGKRSGNHIFRGSESSVGSPNPPSSLYSLSPNAMMLSPPPDHPSAAPSPLRVRIRLDPDAAPFDFAHLPLPALSPTSSSALSTVIPSKDSPAKPISTSPSTQSSDLTKQTTTSAGASSTSPLPDSTSNGLPRTTHHFLPTAYRSSSNSSNPTFSVFPRSVFIPGAAITPSTKTIQEEPLMSGVLTSPPPSRGFFSSNKSDSITNSRPSTSNGNKSSSWRKVFGSSKSNGVVSPTSTFPSLKPSKTSPSSMGHRKSKSGGGIIIVPQDRLEKEREKQRRRAGSFGDEIGKGAGGADAGFTGMGKDGVWISRKNFLKA